MSPSAARAARRARNAVGPATARATAAILGTVAPVWLCTVALARLLPISEAARGSIGMLLPLPLWVTAMCFAFLSRSGLRSWLLCLGATAVFAAVIALT
jgi:hypothetical protein